MQGAISAASAVANAALQAKDFPLPQTLLLQCPANVREQVPCHAATSPPAHRCCSFMNVCAGLHPRRAAGTAIGTCVASKQQDIQKESCGLHSEEAQQGAWLYLFA